jgi:hypothetical protein
MSKLQSLYVLSISILIFLLSSCAHLSYLDAAQDSFNEGASLENEIRLSTNSSPGISPAFYYNRAYVDVNKALKGGGEKKLQNDQLLGHAYSLKALCEWKLGQYQTAIETGNLAKGRFLALSNQGVKLPRDLTLMKALPDIIAIDTVAQSFFAFRKSKVSTNFKDCLAYYQSHIYNPIAEDPAILQRAINSIESLKRGTTNNVELYAYLIMVQLSGLKTWNGGLSLLFESGTVGLSIEEQIKVKEEILDEKQSFFNFQRDRLINELEETLSGEGNLQKQVVDYWKSIM